MSSVNQSCWSIRARLVPQPVAVVAQGSDVGAVWLGRSSKSATAVVPAKASVMSHLARSCQEPVDRRTRSPSDMNSDAGQRSS